MNASSQFPNDENGEVLRRMCAGGDELTQPRMVDFCFAFPERRQALSFAQLVDDKDSKVCISFYTQRDCWQVIVSCFMVPEHKGITAIEVALSIKAESVGGEADGWG